MCTRAQSARVENPQIQGLSDGYTDRQSTGQLTLKKRTPKNARGDQPAPLLSPVSDRRRPGAPE